jgi:hypothetical protein
MPANSYSFANRIRDLNPAWEQMLAGFPRLISLVQVGAPVSNNRAEWLESSSTPVASAITGFDTDGDGVGVNLASTAGIRAGSILRFTLANATDRTELVQVASVDSATDLTVVRDYGGTTGVTLNVGDIAILVSSPLGEGTDPVASGNFEPVVNFNFTQIFERTARVTKTSQYTGMYGIDDLINVQVQEKLREIAREMNNALIYGRRIVRAAGVPGTMGGILQYLTGGNVVATGGNVSATHINAALELIYSDGGTSDRYAIVCSENQARRISAFNTTGSNPVVMKTATDRTFGGYISAFTGDIPVDSSFQAQIVVDPNFPKSQIAIVDLNKVAIKPFVNRAIQDEDATPNGADYYQRRILGEYTAEIMNGTTAHALITGLNL